MESELMIENSDKSESDESEDSECGDSDETDRIVLQELEAKEDERDKKEELHFDREGPRVGECVHRELVGKELENMCWKNVVRASNHAEVVSALVDHQVICVTKQRGKSIFAIFNPTILSVI